VEVYSPGDLAASFAASRRETWSLRQLGESIESRAEQAFFEDPLIEHTP